MAWIKAYLEIPPTIRKEYRHYFLLLNVVGPLALIIHASFLPLFFAIGAMEIAIYNIFSVTSFALAIYWNRAGRHFLAAFLAMIEVIGHAAFAVHTFGWEFGFQYFLMVLVIPAFTYPRSNFWITSGLYLLIVGSFLGMFYYAENHEAIWRGSPLFIDFFNVTNICLSFLILGLGIFYFNLNVTRSEARLETEHERSENLLHNILPREIASQLKQSSRTIADGFEHASVLFADIVGFTNLSQRVAPGELVSLLNEVFSAFDDLALRHDLEKIKTIGDAYMVASGIPRRREDHAAALLDFALDMVAALEDFNRARGYDLELRVGINSGPVVAGVIGKQKFIYDLWGDSVNTAARMESHGISGQIQVTEATHALTREDYIFEERGEIEVKGKGVMRTYLLKGSRALAAV